MSAQVRHAKRSVVGSLLASMIMGSLLTASATPARAETSLETSATTNVCAPLAAQLRWHEPFFGIREWREVAQETLSYASPACRQALAAGQAEEVASALRQLEQRADANNPWLQRYVYKVSCQLRVPSLRGQILAGTTQPGVYVDCVDAVFAQGATDEESTALRERYLEGLAKEPLTTPIPPSTLQAPYVERLAPVLAAYDKAQLAKRDTLFAALCLRQTPTTPEAKAVCAGPAVREPLWAKEKLELGQISDGLSHLTTLAPDQLPQFVALLHKFDDEHRRGRDRLHRMLCQQRVLASPALLPACQTLRAEAEPRWEHEAKTKEINDELVTYHRVAYGVGKFLGLLSLLIIGHALLVNRRRAVSEAAVLELQHDAQ